MNTNYYYTTRRGWPGYTDVVLCSWHTNDVQEVISSHRNAHNARKRAAKLNRGGAPNRRGETPRNSGSSSA